MGFFNVLCIELEVVPRSWAACWSRAVLAIVAVLVVAYVVVAIVVAELKMDNAETVEVNTLDDRFFIFLCNVIELTVVLLLL